MELRKKKEIEYYDKKAENRFGKQGKNKTDFEGFDPSLLSSYGFCYKLLRERCPNKVILDYGCGNGVHTINLAKMGAGRVVGIDLSGKSLGLARETAKREGLADRVEFIKMDCEKTEFKDNTFDVVFDGGTFSSLELKTALPEAARVLKPGGVLTGIETFGHNPFTNLKRKTNKLTGKRTDWAAAHIVKSEDLEMAKNYFGKTEVYFFHLVSWTTFPFLNLFGGSFLLKSLEFADEIFLKLSFLKKYAFKVVFVFSLPKK